MHKASNALQRDFTLGASVKKESNLHETYKMKTDL